MKTIYFKVIDQLKNLNYIPLLILRLILAYGFYDPAMKKLNDIGLIAEWFESIELPWPHFNAYLASYTEFFGFIFLALGFATRFISIPLIITMFVAIKTAHWGNGFSASDNGFEIPLYYMIMLIVLVFNGAGKLSLDHLIGKIIKKQTN